MVGLLFNTQEEKQCRSTSRGSGKHLCLTRLFYGCFLFFYPVLCFSASHPDPCNGRCNKTLQYCRYSFTFLVWFCDVNCTNNGPCPSNTMCSSKQENRDCFLGDACDKVLLCTRLGPSTPATHTGNGARTTMPSSTMTSFVTNSKATETESVLTTSESYSDFVKLYHFGPFLIAS